MVTILSLKKSKLELEEECPLTFVNKKVEILETTEETMTPQEQMDMLQYGTLNADQYKSWQESTNIRQFDLFFEGSMLSMDEAMIEEFGGIEKGETEMDFANRLFGIEVAAEEQTDMHRANRRRVRHMIVEKAAADIPKFPTPELPIDFLHASMPFSLKRSKLIRFYDTLPEVEDPEEQRSSARRARHVAEIVHQWNQDQDDVNMSEIVEAAETVEAYVLNPGSTSSDMYSLKSERY